MINCVAIGGIMAFSSNIAASLLRQQSPRLFISIYLSDIAARNYLLNLVAFESIIDDNHGGDTLLARASINGPNNTDNIQCRQAAAREAFIWIPIQQDNTSQFERYTNCCHHHHHRHHHHQLIAPHSYRRWPKRCCRCYCCSFIR